MNRFSMKSSEIGTYYAVYPIMLVATTFAAMLAIEDAIMRLLATMALSSGSPLRLEGVICRPAHAIQSAVR